MSSRFSELAAELLLAYSEGLSSNRRLLVPGVLGVSPEELYAALAMRATDELDIPVSADGEVHTMGAITLPAGVVVLPYLVVDGSSQDEDPNRGNRGFNGRLRDWFDRDPSASQVRVLVTFDASPIETQTTAMDTTSIETLFAPGRFVEHIERTRLPRVPQALRPIASAILEFTRSVELTADIIATLDRFVADAESIETVESFAMGFARLPWLVPDPEIAAATASRRLSTAWKKHRSRIDSWARSADTDFSGEVRAAYDGEVAEKLVFGRRLGTVQWKEFTLSELEAGLRSAGGDEPSEPIRLDLDQPVSVVDAVAQTWKDLGQGQYAVVALHRSAAVRLRVSLTRPLEGTETVHLLQYEPGGGSFQRGHAQSVSKAEATDQQIIEFSLDVRPTRESWAVFEVVVTKTARYVKRFEAHVSVAVLQAAVSALPYETACHLDVESQAFIVEAEPSMEVISGDGEVASVDVHDMEDDPTADPMSEVLQVQIDDVPIAVPIRYEVSDDEEPLDLVVASPFHAVLQQAAREGTGIPNEAPPVSFVGGQARVTISGQNFSLEPVRGLPTPRWRVEASVLSMPEATSYVLASDGGLAVDESLNSLAVGELSDEFEAFLEARRQFFDWASTASRRGLGTILALDLADSDECAEYLNSYLELLNAVPADSTWESEHARILLCDRVVVPNDGGVWLAPTNPLSVASYRHLQIRLRDWQGSTSGNLGERDTALVSPRFALPFLEHESTLYEARHTGYPWRRYEQLGSDPEATPEPHLPSYIARRIEAFLEVHPLYKDQKRTLELTFINAGRAEHIRDALRIVVRQALRGKGSDGDGIPRFEVRLLADAGPRFSELGAELDAFMGEARESETVDWRDRELMERLSYTKAETTDYLSDARAFAHLAFIEDYFRPNQPQPYNLGDQAGSAYVEGLAPDIRRVARVTANEVQFVNGTWLPHSEAAGERGPLLPLMRRSLELAAAPRGATVRAGQGLGTVTKVSRREIPEIYDRAVWVVHMDRHIGLELFYPQAQGGPTPFILDHTDQENLQESGFDGITATAMVGPYLARIESAFKTVLPEIDESRAEVLLRWLNVISGRWALGLLHDSPAAVRERLGSVMAFRFLVDRELAFSDPDILQVVVSLDEVLRVTGKEGLPTSAGLAAEFGHSGEASDDFLVLRLPLVSDTEPVVLGARVVEVKYAEGGADVEKAARQVRNTRGFVERVFGEESRPGRLFRGRALATLIETYVARLDAFGLLSVDRDDDRLLRALDAVGDGTYRLQLAFQRDTSQLAGDVFTIEPNYELPVYVAPPIASDGETAVGRVRIGAPMINAILWQNTQEISAGMYSAPVWPQITGVEDVPLSTDPGQEGRPEATPEEPSKAPPNKTPAEPGRPAEPADHVGGSSSSASISSGSGDERDVVADEMRRQADALDRIFSLYDLPVGPFNPSQSERGPNVDRFRTRMAVGGTIASIEARARDIQRELGVTDPIFIGQEPPFVVVDVPRAQRETVTFAEHAELLDALETPGALPFLLGADASGAVQVEDLSTLPHLLVAGSTGTGKSVFLLALGAALVGLSPDRVQLEMVDIKGLDFAAFSDLPHLRSGHVIESPDEAVAVLERTIEDEVALRKPLLQDNGARQLTDLYAREPTGSWPPQIVVMIDEYAQLLTALDRGRTRLEGLVQQFAQFARAYGIYLVLATQRPSADVITGRIKANLPARCAFQLPSFNDSRTVIDVGGAEKLLGRGDMLFYREGRLMRYQSVLAGPEDVVRRAGLTSR